MDGLHAEYQMPYGLQILIRRVKFKIYFNTMKLDARTALFNENWNFYLKIPNLCN